MFKSIGKNCSISPRASFYRPEMISIGDNVRIDDFCVLSGGAGLSIGSHIHIACYVSMFAGSEIEIGDFCQIAAYSLILSESDDFTGDSLIGPCIPKQYKPGYKAGKITLEKHVSIGARSTIFPGVTLHEGAICGAHSLVNRDLQSWTINVGVPAREVKKRHKGILDQERLFLCGLS